MNKKATSVRNNQMADQLSSLLNKKKPKHAVKPTPYFENKYDLQSWKADGKDHINIWQPAQTTLGQFLGHDYVCPFEHNVLGRFTSIRGFWSYIQSDTHDDRLRRLSGAALKNVKPNSQIRITNFRAILMDACWQRIKQNPSMLNQLKQSKLPFDCYFIHNTTNMRMRPVFHPWIIAGTEAMRTAAKNGVEPDFGFLMEDKNIPLYDPITPEYLKNRPVEKEETVDTKSPVEMVDDINENEFEEIPTSVVQETIEQ